MSGLVVLFIAVLVSAAYAFAIRRDLGAGLLPERPAPAAAASALLSPLALAWRLHRGTVQATLRLLWLTGISALLVVAGLAGFRRRDIG